MLTRIRQGLTQARALAARVPDVVAGVQRVLVGTPTPVRPLVSYEEAKAWVKATEGQGQPGGTAQLVQHVGWELTPEGIRAAFVAAEKGNPQAQCDIFDDVVERDHTLAALADHRTASLIGKYAQWVPGQQDDESAVAAAIFRREVWPGIAASGLLERQLYHSLLNGYQADQLIWKFSRETRRVDPVGVQEFRPRDFLISTFMNPRVKAAHPDDLLLRRHPFDQIGEALYPGLWLVTKRTTTVPLARAGLGRGSTWWSHIKMLGIADWGVYVRRYGLPFVMATIKDWTSTAERAMAAEILQRIGDDGGAIVAENSVTKIDFKDGAQGSRNAASDLHQRLASTCNEELTKRWYGAALASESGSGASSYALAREHGGLRFEIMAADAMRLSLSLGQLAQTWMAVNDLPGAAPVLRFHLVRISDPKLFAQTAKIVSQELGIPIDQEQVLEYVGMRLGEGENAVRIKDEQQPSPVG
jgi:phage gp29-like protein